MNRFISACCLALLILWPATTVWAAAGSEKQNSLISYQESLVPEGQTVNSVLLVGKNGIIAGTVKDEVIVIQGSVVIKSTARVADRVFVIGGDIQQEPGARVGKGVFNISTSDATINSFILGLITFFGIEVIKLILSICLILAAVIVMIAAPGTAGKTAKHLREGTLKSAVLGILGLVSFGLLMAAMASSIWGIPVALLVLVLLLVLLIIGFAGMSLVFGGLLREGVNLTKWSNSTAQTNLILTCMGSLLLVAMLNLPIVGPVWGLLVIVLALGSAVQMLFVRGVRETE